MKEQSAVVLELARDFANCLSLTLDLCTADQTSLQVNGLNLEKILCEICLFLHIAHDHVAASASLHSEVQLFLERSKEHLLTSGRMSYIERYPSSVHLFALYLLCCLTYGVSFTEQEAMFQALRSPAYLSKERVPFRLQESIWLFDQITKQKLTGADGSCCLLARATHPCVLSREDLYAKTHTAMYETNFGRVRAAPRYLTREVSIGLVHDLNSSFCRADWDLVGELYMASRFLDSHSGEQTYRRALEAIFRKFGFIPSITYDTGKAATLAPDELRLYRFAHSYHTTLVYGILCACCTEGRELAAGKEERVEWEHALAAIAKYFGSQEFDRGPLCKDWYADDFSVPIDIIIDGYAARCYKNFGAVGAIQFIDSIPYATDLPLVQHSRGYLASLQMT